jgi:hypothetical protein
MLIDSGENNTGGTFGGAGCPGRDTLARVI